MRENFLHYLWRTRQFEVQQLVTTENEPLLILDYGQYNTDSGADFAEARIQIGAVVWVGHVEMHLLASDWHRHQHSADRAYDNVILHVVFEEDEPVVLPHRGRLPCLELRHRIPPGLYQRYWGLLHTEAWIPCQAAWPSVSEWTKKIWLERVLVERLLRKTADFTRVLAQNQGDWAETFHQFLARSLGMKVNADPMQWLAQSLPHRLLAKHRNQVFQLEALLFGQAGFLDKAFSDAYPQALQQEYAFLRHKYDLSPINAVSWKFMRMRPPNFPTIRLAQWAQIIHKQPFLMSKIVEMPTLPDLSACFEVQVSDYWHTHFSFDTPSVPRSKMLGKTAIEVIIINTIVPFLFFYGQNQGDNALKDRALDLLAQIEPEDNALVNQWQNMGTTVASAYDTQALLQLKTAYCEAKRCLDCAVGHAILKT